MTIKYMAATYTHVYKLEGPGFLWVAHLTIIDGNIIYRNNYAPPSNRKSVIASQSGATSLRTEEYVNQFQFDGGHLGFAWT